MLSFLRYYIKSMRLYYCFVTLTAGYVGMTLVVPEKKTLEKAIICAVLFFCWGVNQIINDFLNRKEDRINAPKRPMVSGKLDPKKALSLSILILISIAGYAVFKNPYALVPAAAGILLNIIYAVAKGYGPLGNLLFGMTIACTTWFGYTLAGGNTWGLFTDHLKIYFAVVAFNMIMTYFTYFKDNKGDKAAGKETIIVKLGPKNAGRLGFILCFIPAIILFLFPINSYYAIAASIGSALFFATGLAFMKNPKGPNTYFNLKYNFAAICAAQSALVSLNYPKEGLILCIISVIGVFLVMGQGYKNAAE